jgi:hypothetical protein
MRSVAAGNKRHVQTMYAELKAAEERSRKAERAADLLADSHRRAEIAETELRTLRDGIRELGGDPTQIQNLWAQLTLTSRQRGEEMARADRAQAAIVRVRAAVQWARRTYPGMAHVHERLAAALDGTEQPTTEASTT